MVSVGDAGFQRARLASGLDARGDSARVSERVACDLRDQTYSHLQRLSLEYFGGKRTGDLMSRISTDSDRLCQFLADSVVDFAADALLLICVSAALFWENATLGLATLLPFPLIVWLMYKCAAAYTSAFKPAAGLGPT